MRALLAWKFGLRDIPRKLSEAEEKILKNFEVDLSKKNNLEAVLFKTQETKDGDLCRTESASAIDGLYHDESVLPGSDEYFMLLAMEQARLAEEIDEVPIGAVAVRDGKIIACGYNTRESSRCATHHAELICIENACRALGGWRLPGVTLYVTLEPCAMCAGAIINARIERVVFGAADHRFGALGSLVNLAKIPFNHIPQVDGGVLADNCASLLSEYFKKKRKNPK